MADFQDNLRQLIVSLLNLLTGSYTVSNPTSVGLSTPGTIPQNPVNVPSTASPSGVNTFVQVLPLNKKRKQWILHNFGTQVVYVKLGNPPNANSSDYSFPLPPSTVAGDGTGGIVIDDLWKGAVFCTAKTGTGVVLITEMI